MSDQNKTVALPEGEYAQYLSTLAANIADERIIKRDQKWRSFMSVVITILAIFGFINISSIKSELNSNIVSIKSEVDSDISDIKNELQSKLEPISK